MLKKMYATLLLLSVSLMLFAQPGGPPAPPPVPQTPLTGLGVAAAGLLIGLAYRKRKNK